MMFNDVQCFSYIISSMFMTFSGAESQAEAAAPCRAFRAAPERAAAALWAAPCACGARLAARGPLGRGPARPGRRALGAPGESLTALPGAGRGAGLAAWAPPERADGDSGGVRRASVRRWS